MPICKVPVSRALQLAVYKKGTKFLTIQDITIKISLYIVEQRRALSVR